MDTKVIDVSWAEREHYHDRIRVPKDFDETNTEALAELIRNKTSYNWQQSDGIEITNIEVK